MQIEKIDRNFDLRKSVDGAVRVKYTIPHDSFDLYGVLFDESKGFVRMPVSVAEKVSDGVCFLNTNTAGGRLRFATDSSVIQIEAEYSQLCMMSHMPLTGSSGFSLFEETEDGERFIMNLAPVPRDVCGFRAEAATGGKKMRNYILYFPLYNDVKKLSVFLESGATVTNGKKYKARLPILYYGSSITQGGCASRPDNSYQALIAKRNNVDYINLGFSGNARAEDEMKKYLAGIDCSLFVCDYDHNAPSAEFLKATHERLYRNYRRQRPQTPILFLSKPDFGRTEQDAERLEIIQETYRKARADGDENVYFLSGKKFYDGKNRWDYSVDGVHPTDFGFHRMATEIYKEISKILGE